MHTILICDDDRDIVSALKIYLTSEGYQTVEAYNGEEAVAAVRGGNIDLILMDVMMPKLDGIRATAKLREEGNIPIILLTAKSEDSDKVLGLNIGADDYITKPFNPIEVLARVKSQLRRYTTLGGKSQADQEGLSAQRLHRYGRRSQDGSGGRGERGAHPHRIQHPAPASEKSRAGCTPPPRSTSRCGTTPLWVRKTRWPSTSATCGRRSRSTRPIPGT